MAELRKIVIDGIEVEVDPDLAVIQACEQAGIEIPRFCYHERLSIAGNCRMCLVEVVGGPPKPQASCHLQVKDLRPGKDNAPPVILTNSPMVKKAREGVMEFLLINHPLDCPICDQGGECDLQDQAMAYGVDFSRYREPKRASDEIDLGPLIKTHMTRCIQCTRCVRFVTEIAGVPELGCTGRGEDAEILSYLDRALTSELQGNVIDLCPVGALTSRPYAFNARPWELTKTESVDVMDALGAAIRIDTRGREVMRILPRENADVNEEWLDDRSRFVWDGLRRQRLDRPYLRGVDGRLRPASWGEAFGAIASRLAGLPGSRIAGLVGELAPLEAVVALKDLLAALGSEHLDCREPGAMLDPAAPASWLLNPGVAGLEAADAVLLVGTNPRAESPVLNARLRKMWAAGAEIGVLGAIDRWRGGDLTYPARRLGTDARALSPGGAAEEFLKRAKRPLVLVGQGAVRRADGRAVQAAAMALAERVGAVKPSEGRIGYGMLHVAAGRVGALMAGATPGAAGRDAAAILAGAEAGEIGAVYLLGADEIDMRRLGAAFVIYQGSHGDAGAARADVVLPAAAWTEEAGLFVNTEGRVQLAARATFPPGEARENWAVLRALSAELGKRLPYDSLAALRATLFAAHPALAAVGARVSAPWEASRAAIGEAGAVSAEPLHALGRDFYLANPIARASQTMAALSRMAAEPSRVAAE